MVEEVSTNKRTSEEMSEVATGKVLSTAARGWRIAAYVAVFAVVVIGVATAMDAYLCLTAGKANGAVLGVNVNLASKGDVDLTVNVGTMAWFESRLHTVTVRGVTCDLSVSTPSGDTVAVSNAAFVPDAAQPLVLQPKPLFAPLRGDALATGRADAEAYYVNGTVAITATNFPGVKGLLVNVLMDRDAGVHSFVSHCAVDGVVALYSVPALSVPFQGYPVTARRHLDLSRPAAAAGAAASEAGGSALRRSLQDVDALTSDLQSWLSAIPLLGPSFANVPFDYYKLLVQAITESPLNILYLIEFPLSWISFDVGQSDAKGTYAKFNVGFSLKIPPPYAPSFLVNVIVPPLTLQVTSGIYGTLWSWLLQTRSSAFNIANGNNFIQSKVSCAPIKLNCTLATPIYGFTSNLMRFQRDTWLFNMLGPDTFLSRATGHNNSIAYSMAVSYDQPSKMVNHAFSVCVNVTISNRWQIQNACAVRPPGAGEVDVSFTIPSVNGTQGTYLGMTSAFTWTYVPFNPSYSPTRIPTSAPTAPSVAPTVAIPTLAPTVGLTVTPTFAPTMAPTVAHDSVIVVVQDVTGILKETAIGSLDFATWFATCLQSLYKDPTYPIPAVAQFTLTSVQYTMTYPNSYQYVARVTYTVTVHNGDAVVPTVANNLAACVYSGSFQKLLQQAYPTASTSNGGSIRIQMAGQPTSQPTQQPTEQPSRQPTTQPTEQPTRQPTTQPTEQPTRQPTEQPTLRPISHPTGRPSKEPTSRPSQKPTSLPTSHPSAKRTARPSAEGDTSQPVALPKSKAPSAPPSFHPSYVPTRPPTGSDGCVHISYMYIRGSTNIVKHVPSFGDAGANVLYNVTMQLFPITSGYASGQAWFGSGPQSTHESRMCSPFGWDTYWSYYVGNPVCSDLYLSSTGVWFNFQPQQSGASFQATVCAVSSRPTPMPSVGPSGGLWNDFCFVPC